MPWDNRDEEVDKYMEPKGDKALCHVKGCWKGRKGRSILCLSHVKRVWRRGTLLVKGTTALDSRWRRPGRVRNPYGIDNSSKSSFVAGLIREVDSGTHHTQA